jgi:hypothetical protein
MLITFSCEAYSNVTLFGDVGLQILKMMGYDGKPSGIISADAVPTVLKRLEKAAAPLKEVSTSNHADTSFSDEPVSLANRALPVIELLKAAAQDKCNVWWESRE